MNIQCPKCQFSQPQDQYCAQCGVDISRYTKNSSSKIKTLLIKSSIPISLIILGAISLTYKSKQSCPPLCTDSQQLSAIIPPSSTKLKRFERQATPLQQKQKVVTNINRKVSSVNVDTSEKDKPKNLPPTKPAFKKILSFKVEAQLVRFSKDLTDLIQENPSLKILSIKDSYLKNTLLENSEILNDFTEQDIKKALKILKPSPINSKGLKLIVLNKHITQPGTKARLFFETLNLNLENLRSDKDPDTFIAILINVH